MLIATLKREIDQIAKDNGIDSGEIIGALESAMEQAAHKRHGPDKEIEARYNDELGEIELFEFMEVVEVVTDRKSQIEYSVAIADYDPEAEIGDQIGIKMDTTGFGRILAQAAKQVIIQRLRDAERDHTYDEYADRKGELVNGIVRRFEKGSLIVDLGRTEAILPPKEQVPREGYRPGDRIRAYVLDVNRMSKGPQIILSRTATELLTKLFEQEVPEMYEKIVTIEAAAREPGGRSKIAVSSRDSDVDPVGACVGMKGSRVQSVVQELRGERIDIVPWNADAARYVYSALSPAQVSKVIIDEETHAMDVIVPDDQLSLAIGRRGQNVRLAVQLTGWKIDIKSESKMKEIAEWLSRAISTVEGCGDPEAELLLQQGVTSLEDLARCSVELLTSFPGIDEDGAGKIKVRATELVDVKVQEEREAAEAAAEAATAAQAAAATAAEAAAVQEESEESEENEESEESEESEENAVAAEEAAEADPEAGVEEAAASEEAGEEAETT
ncbi:MAG: transcription termination factor NusA [Myxococcota bacterium]|nr:transcription termination factor NusA [Myxococcota bacterium]